VAQRVGHTRGRSAAVDMTGRVCGNWTVLRCAPHVPGQRGLRWEARHVCGAERVLLGYRLRYSPPKTCTSCCPYGKGRVAPEWLLGLGLSEHAKSVILGWCPSYATANRGYRAPPITSLRELKACTDLDLLRRPGCGRKTLREILRALGR